MTIPADKSPDPINPNKPIESIGKPVTPETSSGFESYMQGTAGKGAPPPGTEGPQGVPHPMDVAGKAPISATGTDLSTLSTQATNAKDSLGQVEKQLNDQKLKLKRSQNHLVRQKLEDANSYIRAAGSKVGAKLTDQKLPPGASGISRFIAMVNDGQDQLMQVQQKLHELAAKGQQLNPGDIMAVQIKMGLAQQEIEYTSTLLSKVIQSVTQVINTQL